MADILMIAEPSSVHSSTPALLTVLWLSAEAFWQREELVKKHDAVLWQAFHTHGKYARIVTHATWFAVAVDTHGQYVSSAFVIAVGQKWLIEYVMTDPEKRGGGAASSVMNEVMRRAQEDGVRWVLLNCDPKADNGHLVTLYEKFGFAKVS